MIIDEMISVIHFMRRSNHSGLFNQFIEATTDYISLAILKYSSGKMNMPGGDPYQVTAKTRRANRCRFLIHKLLLRIVRDAKENLINRNQSEYRFDPDNEDNEKEIDEIIECMCD